MYVGCWYVSVWCKMEAPSNANSHVVPTLKSIAKTRHKETPTSLSLPLSHTILTAQVTSPLKINPVSLATCPKTSIATQSPQSAPLNKQYMHRAISQHNKYGSKDP
jgi:hypothetical protein